MSFKKVARKVLYAILFIVALFIILQLSLNFYINRHLVENLKNQVSEATHHKYRLELDRATVSFFNRSVTLNRINFIPEKTSDYSHARYGVEAKSISLTGINIWHYVRTKSMTAASLNFDSLSISIYQAERGALKKDTASARLSLYKILSKNLKELMVERISIADTRVAVYKAGKDSTRIMFSNDSDIEIEKFLFNEKVDSMNRLFLADKFRFTMKTFSYSLPNGLYNLKGRSLTASYADSSLTADSLELVSNYSKKDINEAAGHQASWIKLKMAGIEFSKMNLNLFVEENWFIAKKLHVDDFLLETYKDKNAEFKHQVKPSVQAILRKIPFLIKIDTIDVKNANVINSIVAPGAGKPGRVSFNRLHGFIANICNDTLTDKTKGEIRMSLHGWFLNKGKFSALYVFPLNTNQTVFDFSGKMTDMSLSEINSILENTAGISIKSGHLDTMTVQFHANEKESNGKMYFLYHGLTVEFLDRHDKTKNLKKKLMSFFANKFVIIDSNPSKEGRRISAVHYEHYPYKTFFYYTQKSIESGIFFAIGIKNVDNLLKVTDNR